MVFHHPVNYLQFPEEELDPDKKLGTLYVTDVPSTFSDIVFSSTSSSPTKPI